MANVQFITSCNNDDRYIIQLDQSMISSFFSFYTTSYMLSHVAQTAPVQEKSPDKEAVTSIRSCMKTSSMFFPISILLVLKYSLYYDIHFDVTNNQSVSTIHIFVIKQTL